MELNTQHTTDKLGRKEQLAEMKQLEQDYRDKHDECFRHPERHNSESDDGDYSNYSTDSTDSTDLSELRELGDRYATIRSQLGLPPREL